MNDSKFAFDLIERHVRKRTFGVFTTIDKKGRPHSTGILFGIAPPESKFTLFSMVGANYQKTKNVRRNPKVSLVVPFPHYYLRFVPDNYVMFRGNAELISFDDPDAQWAFQQSRILRMSLDTDATEAGGIAVIKINPEPKVFVYGLGYSLMELRSSHGEGSYSVMIPENRL